VIETPIGILAPDADGTTAIALYEPALCPCGHFAAFFVNRYGRTLCVSCDVEAQRNAPEPPAPEVKS
jgi:hypothetical protein